MRNSRQLQLCGGLLGLFFVLISSAQAQAAVEVRFKEGLVRGFVVLQTLDGDTIAHGDLAQVARGESVTSHLILHFKDGSMYDETVNFSQRGHLKY